MSTELQDRAAGQIRAFRRYSTWDSERQERLRVLWAGLASADAIADELETSRGAIYMQASKMGLKRRAPHGQRLRAGDARPRGPQRPAPKRAADKTRRRRFEGVISNGEGARVILESYHPASREGATIFGNSVLPASKRDQILKSGVHSRKLGAEVEKGRWKGMPILSLTLEERETCPRSCLEWATCYGNNMPFAHRTTDDGTLTRRLWGELASLNAKHPKGFVVRLHVLGDFYSVEYVDFWRQSLIDFPALRVFGFTARKPPDPIGNALGSLVNDMHDRFMVRFSGSGLEQFGAEVVDKAEDATGILCPAESDEKRCCATCALCMQTSRTISFIRH